VTKSGFVFLCLFCVVIYIYVCFFVFVLFFQYSAKRLAGKNVFEMTYFVSSWA